MPATMQAVVKAKAAPGIELREVPVPAPGPGEVLVRVQTASVCGADLHIYNWDPEAMRLGFALLRAGGRASLLGIPSRPFELDFARDIIFKGATVQGINGRKMFETWFQMEALLATGKLNLEPVITHRLKLSEFERAMAFLESGEAIKAVMRPD
jgi:threonine 3-dehydrogenase